MLDDVVFYQLPGFVFALFPLAELAKDAGVAPGSGFGGFALAYNVARKEDVDAAMAEASAAGARILRPAQTVFWGGYSGYFADPDGHAWEIAWNEECTIHPDGSTTFPAPQ